MLWYRGTATGGVEVKELGVTGAAVLATGTVDDATAVNVANIRALDFGNILKFQVQFEIRSRQLITTGNETVTMLLPLNTVLGSHRENDTVMLGVKHTYDDRRNSTANYLHSSTNVADDKFKIEHLTV